MTEDLRKILQENYFRTQAQIASGSIYKDIRQAWPYYQTNYGSHIRTLKKEARIAEIGCGSGSLLAWLQASGFRNLVGIESSPGDAEFAKKHLDQVNIILGEGRLVMERYPSAFDAVFIKAVLEHQRKEELFPFVLEAARSVKPGGIVVIDVPNMDWAVASHERYMDLTHEVGFTKESLRTLLKLVFDEVKVFGSRPGLLTRSQRLFRRPLVWMLRQVFCLLGEGAGEVLFESRSIIAVARKPCISGYISSRV